MTPPKSPREFAVSLEEGTRFGSSTPDAQVVDWLTYEIAARDAAQREQVLGRLRELADGLESTADGAATSAVHLPYGARLTQQGRAYGLELAADRLRALIAELRGNA